MRCEGVGEVSSGHKGTGLARSVRVNEERGTREADWTPGRVSLSHLGVGEPVGLWAEELDRVCRAGAGSSP